MIENYLRSDKGEIVISYEPVSQIQIFQRGSTEDGNVLQRVSVPVFRFGNFHIIKGIEKPVLMLTDNKSLTRLLEAGTMPPSFWN